MARWARVIAGVVGLLVCLLIAFQVDATVGKKVRYANLKGFVTDSHDRIIVGATVYVIDSSTVNTTPITPSAILDGTAEAYDEPLEDLISVDSAKPAKEQTISKAVTNKKGQFRIRKLNRDALYYAHVVPAAADADHLPGGDASRIAFSPKAISRKGLTIKISWKAPEDATRIGTSACYVCHGSGSEADVSTCKRHGHALMFNKPGQPTANQDPANHPGANVLALQEKFTTATAYSDKGVKTLYFQEYDATAKSFAVYEDTPGTKVDPTTGKGGDIWIKAYLWRTGVTSNYNITLENVKVTKDPNNFITFPVKLFMGAYLRQRIFVTVPGLKSTYPVLEYRAMPDSASQGVNGQYDRSRVPFAESSFSNFYTYASKTKTMALTAGPPAVSPTTGTPTSNITCALCHLGLGIRSDPFQDSVTGESLAHTIADPNGVFDLGGDDSLQDVGIGCEECHGPGSKHREEALKGVFPATSKRSMPVDNSAKYIVNPGLLGADRASLICGRCHDARGILKEAAGEPRPPAGISRAEFLAKYVDAKGLSTAQLWPDGESGRGGHHGFTYDNWLISKHAKNSRQLVACDDCHDAMGDSQYRYFLKGDPDDPNGGLCTRCHAVDVNTHVVEKTGSVMKGASMACRQCHMTRTGKAGAGRPGLLLDTPTGLSSDANIIYWEGDQSAHHMHVLSKFTAGVAGVQPGLAMPTPYTNSCGTCHDATKLQFQQPN
ncbi:MAG: hypothetical protein NTW87_29475 [Planctomycetota bacterium]|nr:hypothetical protein [Planctomycetota bacterium]